MKKTLLLLAALFFFQTAVVWAQTEVSLQTILTETEKQTQKYLDTFKNLLADESKTFEEFDKQGNIDKTTTVKSSFLVYQSGKNVKRTAELRNVLEVNGKALPGSQQRGEQFLAELEKASTYEKELQKLANEGSRFDKTLEIYGWTLNQGVALAPNLRPYFDFTLLGTENYQGSEVYVVSYQQTKKSPYSVVNEKLRQTDDLSLTFNLSVPGALKKTDKFLRGKLWIDAKTFQIWREERELTIQTVEPVVLLSNVFEYQTSDYEILVPKNITLKVFEIKKLKGNDKYVSVKDINVNFEYSRFRQTNTEVKILDDETD